MSKYAAMNIDEIAAGVGMTTMEVANVLDKAADEMEIRGHTKGAMIKSSTYTGYDKEGEGKVCLLGAIAAALGLTDMEIRGGQYKISQSEVVTMLKAYMVAEGITVTEPESVLMWNPYAGMRTWQPNTKNYEPSPIQFNDHCDTKPEEVVDLLRHASKWMREIDGAE